MNQQILQLAVQSGIKSAGETALSPAEQKFAELIIQECISKYDEWAGHTTDLISFSMARHHLREHFGVE